MAPDVVYDGAALLATRDFLAPRMRREECLGE